MANLRESIHDELGALNTLTVSRLEFPLIWLFAHATNQYFWDTESPRYEEH